MPINLLRHFFKLETASGILLILATLLAIFCNNSWLAPFYNNFLTLHMTIAFGSAALDKPLLLWINDGLMAIFFLLVALELKREFLEGELNCLSSVRLPIVAAIGGMVAPALIFLATTHGHAAELKNGWAIPTATDIAFALGVLSLFGRRVSLPLKLFLLAIAIFDDIGAIAIIALFHTKSLSFACLALALVFIVLLALLNARGVHKQFPYIIIGILLWITVLKSGIHATLAGVVVGLFIPIKADDGTSPLRHLERQLHPWVAYFIMPLFAFANAGLSFHGLHARDILNPLPLGIVLGLFAGKQLGIFFSTFAMIKLKYATMPKGANWLSLYGVSILCGIGFTMSLFIGSLAFSHLAEHHTQVRLGVLVGSALSCLLALLVLKCSLNNTHHT